MTTEPETNIEMLAAEFLGSVPSYIWNGRTLPVPVEDIADSHAGLLVRDVEDLSIAPGAPVMTGEQSLSGLLLPGRGEIWVNAREGRQSPGRRRFTIAHELGHWQLHRRATHAVFCRAAIVESDDKPERPLLPVPEVEANSFAAAVLMPPALVSEYYAAFGSDFVKLCNTFGASGAAMGRRLHTVIPRQSKPGTEPV